MFKGTKDGKSLVELSIKQIDQKIAYEVDHAATQFPPLPPLPPLILRRSPLSITPITSTPLNSPRPSTPRPTDLAEDIKKIKLSIE